MTKEKLQEANKLNNMIIENKRELRNLEGMVIYSNEERYKFLVDFFKASVKSMLLEEINDIENKLERL